MRHPEQWSPIRRALEEWVADGEWHDLGAMMAEFRDRIPYHRAYRRGTWYCPPNTPVDEVIYRGQLQYLRDMLRLTMHCERTGEGLSTLYRLPPSDDGTKEIPPEQAIAAESTEPTAVVVDDDSTMGDQFVYPGRQIEITTDDDDGEGDGETIPEPDRRQDEKGRMGPEAAERIIRAILAHGPVESAEAWEKARATGMTWYRWREAYKRLGIRKIYKTAGYKKGFCPLRLALPTTEMTRGP